MRNGASGYVLKQAAGDELIEAVRAVAGGLTYLTPLITRDVLLAMAQPDDAQEISLTPRQLDVLRLIAEGKRMKEIANELQISVRTVETHKQSLHAHARCRDDCRSDQVRDQARLDSGLTGEPRALRSHLGSS